MSYTAAGLESAAVGVSNAGRTIVFFTAAPPTDGTIGATEVSGGSYARQQTTWTPGVADGSVPGSQVTTPIPGGTTVTHWGLVATNGTTLLYSDNLRDGSGNAVTEGFGVGGNLQYTPTITAVNKTS